MLQTWLGPIAAVIFGVYLCGRHIQIKKEEQEFPFVDFSTFKIKSQRNYSVCIVGAGIGSASAAYYLKRELPNIEIFVFEAEADVGGRIKSDNHSSNTSFEAGAAILHGANLMFKYFATDVLGLKTVSNEKRTFAIYDGDKFLFESHTNKWINTLLMLTRYGADLMKLSSNVDTLLAKFHRLYISLHNNSMTFETPEELWSSVGLSDLMKEPLIDYLRRLKISDRFLEELSDPINRVNYGQSSSSLNALAGMVSLATTSAKHEIWKVEGGNQRVVEGLFVTIGARVYLNDPVSEIRKQASQWEVRSSQRRTKLCDSLILAAPLLRADSIPYPITIQVKEDEEEDSGMDKAVPLTQYYQSKMSSSLPKYQSTHATFVKGRINARFFGRESVPQAIYTTEIQSAFFTSVALQPNSSDVFKVFSREELSSNQLEELFGEAGSFEVLARYPWKAYPAYHPPDEGIPFVLDHRLYYLSGLEMGASAVEVGAIAGKNTANLVVADLLRS